MKWRYKVLILTIVLQFLIITYIIRSDRNQKTNREKEINKTSGLLQEDNITKDHALLKKDYKYSTSTLPSYTAQYNNSLSLFENKHKLVNLSNFEYKITKENICKDEVLLLVVVSSAPNNLEKRNTIRQTWGYSKHNVVIVFIIGDVEDTNLGLALLNEDEIYHDIVQGNFLDAYKNLTYKSTLSLKFAVEFCPSAEYILKCDDDTFVNMPLLKNFLKYNISDLYFNENASHLFCNVMDGSPPIRDPTGPYRKWYVSYNDWPEETYPIYCSGWYALMTYDVALKIFIQAQNSSFLWVDDVFLTGVAAGKVQNIKYVSFWKYSLYGIEHKDWEVKLKNNTLDVCDLLFGNVDTQLVRHLWNYVSSRPVCQLIDL